MLFLGRDILISIIIIVGILRIYKKGKKTKGVFIYNTGIILFVIAMVFIFTITGISPVSGFHLNTGLNEISLIPFKGIIEILQGGINLYSIKNIVGNIILFIPIGFLIPILYDKFNSLKRVVLFSFMISLIIELTQLFLIRGTDIDDLMLNTIGGMLGYIVLIIFKNIFNEFTKKLIVQLKDIQNKFVLILGILVPYVVIVICGFGDRYIQSL